MPPTPLSNFNRLLQRPPPCRLPSQRCLPAITAVKRSFVTGSRLNSDQTNKGPQENRKSLGHNSPPSSPNPEYPSFSLKDLGANRTSKIVILVCLSVLGTMESIFWVKVAWAKFGPVQWEEKELAAKGE